MAQSSEIPVVTFKNKLFAELLFEDPDGGFKTFEYATLKPVRDQSKNLLAPPVIKSVGIDLNNDGVYDQWNITMRVRKPENDLKLSQASLIAAFDYQTRDSVKMQMESLAVAQIRIPSSSDKICASKVTTSGTLKLK